MYVPSYKAFLRAAGVSEAEVVQGGHVTIPLQLYKVLIQIAVAHGEFDEQSYLENNPDIKEAIANGTVLNARLHYVGYGYFENRQGGLPKVDEGWYRKTYPDVANAIARNQISSCSEHFAIIGGAELRSPNRAVEKDAFRWKEDMNLSAVKS